MSDCIAETVSKARLCLFVACVWCFFSLAYSLAFDGTSAVAERINFTNDVQPIFKARCVECHGATRQRGNLRLDIVAGIRKGGISGSIINLKNPLDSHLVLHVKGAANFERMPPKGDALTTSEIEKLSEWIRQGAVLPVETENIKNTIANQGGWSFIPLKLPVPPLQSNNSMAWVRNPIDLFILEKLRKNGLNPAPEADKRILARRIFIDLTGLPPTPYELLEFLNDAAPNAYEKLVDRLLASTRYGERWARHWLDVAHYADSHGQDQDRFRPNAWPYRDYLIRSFNEDKPYSRFISEQIAGDVLYPGDPDALVATGFLAAGPWDESGLRDINENSVDRQIARNLDRDDIVTSTMTTFTGLTVHCARCHDHKFDPITQVDYYALQAVFAGVDKAQRAYDPDPVVAKKRLALQSDLQMVRALKGKVDPILLSAQNQRHVAHFEKDWRAGSTSWFVLKPEMVVSKSGSTLVILPDNSVVANGVAPEKDIYSVTVSTPRTGATGIRLEVLTDEKLPFKGPGRAVNGNLHLSELKVRIHPRGKPEKSIPLKLKSATADFSQAGWSIDRAIDGDVQTAWGIHPEEGKSHQAVFGFENPIGFDEGTVFHVELDQSHGRMHLIGRFRLSMTTALSLNDAGKVIPPNISLIMETPLARQTDVQRAEISQWLWENRILKELATMPPQSMVYCGTNQYAADGSFRPALTPRPINILARGEISKPGALAAPGAVLAVPGLKADFQIKDPNDEGQRRVALADWLSNPANMLTWRVIVNRIWHYHFGKGIVDTPNDFGKMGGIPSHPELLDWLASDFVNSGGSLKNLHRLIVTSSTYRQSVKHEPVAFAKDSDNRLLWRMNRGRMDAETLRDSVLLASARLDDSMYGPPVRHFIMKPGIHVTPEADYDRYDVDAPEARRRSVYRYIFRTRPDPLLEALDCPDASQSAPARSVSVSAPQALVLWNNKFVLRHAGHLADLAVSFDTPLQRVRFVTQQLLCRLPTPAEEATWLDYSTKHGLANFCRVLLNSSEFLFID